MSLDIRRFCWIACFSGLTIGQLAVTAAIPKALSDLDWSAIKKEHLRHRQAAVPVNGGWLAPNLQQRWSTYFDRRGFEVTPTEGSWKWGLRLISYGYRGSQRSAGKATPAADVEKLWYQWDSDLREWYVNGEALEHGYTLTHRPGAGSGLQFHLEVLGTLKPQITADGSSVVFIDRERGSAVVNYGGLKVTDATGRQLSAFFAPDPSGLRLEIDDTDARYPVTVDPIAQQAYLKASIVGASDRFGYSVAVDGDLAVIGAPFESSNGSSPFDNSANSAGAAYVFHREAGTWYQAAYIKASNPDAFDQFGFSVAVDQATLTVVIGAVGEDGSIFVPKGNNIHDLGAVYVYKLIPPVCTTLPCFGQFTAAEQGYLKPPTSIQQPDSYFGSAVSISGDTIVVGQPNFDLQCYNCGTPAGGLAHFFIRSAAGVWSWQSSVAAPTLPFGVYFGTSVGISGNTAVVGAYRDNLFYRSGAYVFTRTGTTWSLEATLLASNRDVDDWFGFSVAISGDTIVVGAPAERGNGTSPANNSLLGAGAAYVYNRTFPASGPIWTEQAYLKAPTPVGFAQFGYSVGLSGDAIVVGAPSVNSGIGVGYLYRRDLLTGLWNYQDNLVAANQDGGDKFGNAVAVSGGDVVIGAPGESSDGTSPANNAAIGAGAAYIFPSSGGKTLVSITISAPLLTIAKGSTTQFRAIGSYSDNSTADITTQVTWISSSPGVTVASTGLATGAAVGSSNISATMGQITSNSLQLTVVPPALTSITATTPNTHIPWGTTAQFTATGFYADGSNANITSQVNWTSSNTPSVTITANGGLAKAVGLGSSVITASLSGITSNAYTLTVLCANNVSAATSVTRGPITRNFVTGLYTQQVTVKNINFSGASIAGPVALALDSLSANATLANKTGAAACNLPSSAYLDLNTGIPFGQSITFTLQFANPTNQAITYGTRVLSGPNPR